MVNILILSGNPSQTRQLTGTLLRLAPDLKIRVAQTHAEAERFVQEMRLRLAFVDQEMTLGQELALSEQLRRQQMNRFLPIVVLEPGSRGEAGEAGEGPCLPDATGDRRNFPSDESCRQALGMLSCPFPFDPDELKNLLDHVFVEWRSREHRPSPRVLIDQASSSRWLSEDDIVFVEYASRRVVIHTRKESIEYKYMPLQKFAEKLSSQFIQVHQSYVVNFSAVKSYNRQLAVLKLAGSTHTVPVGRSYQKIVAELIRGNGDGI